MNKSQCFCLIIMVIYANTSIFAKKVGKSKVRAAPAWNPQSSEEEPTVLTRRFLTPATLPPLPLPPVNPDEDLDDRSVLIAANAEDDNEGVFPTTETTNIRILPFEGRRHQKILPIPPPISEQIEEASSGEEELHTGIIIPSTIEVEESSENQQIPSTEVIIPENSDEPPSILVPTESRSVEFIEVDRQDGNNPPSIRPPPRVQVQRPKPPPKLLPPSPIPRQSRILLPSSEIQSAELESEELVPVVRPIDRPPENYRIVKSTEPPKIEKKVEYGERPLSVPRKTRKMYKVYRPDVIEVDRGPPSRSVYVAKRPPILVEEMEIPDELLQSLQKSTTTPAPKTYLHRGSGQFSSRRLTYRRIYKPTTQLPETTTTQPLTTLPPPITRRYTTSTKRLLFTYRQRFITTTPKAYSRTKELPIEFVYKKSPTSSSYHKFIVRRKQVYKKPNTVVYRKQAKTYPKHRKYSRTNYKNHLFPSGYQRQLTRHSFYGYA